MARLILIEGLPGSGKTSLAEWVFSWLSERGVSASWAREEQRDHPVIGRATRRTASTPGYGRRCSDRWRLFAASATAGPDPHVYVMEGCFLQSTVRFLLEYEHPLEEAEQYLAVAEEALVPLDPRLIFLTQPEPEAFLEKELPRRKGAELVSRIASYTETTPYARARGLQGVEGMCRFYTRYRHLCHSLMSHSRLPRLEVDSASRSLWSVRSEVAAWLVRDSVASPTHGVAAGSQIPPGH